MKIIENKFSKASLKIPVLVSIKIHHRAWLHKQCQKILSSFTHKIKFLFMFYSLQEKVFQENSDYPHILL